MMSPAADRRSPLLETRTTVASTVGSMLGRWDDSERAALVALLATRPGGMSWPEITAEVAEQRSALAVWSRSQEGHLFPDEAVAGALDAAVDDVASWRSRDFRFLTFLDDDYPSRLRDVTQVPPLLFTRGTLVPGDRGVSVVGSRGATDDGLAFAHEVATEVARAGHTVISGLAAGIDATAHSAAMAVGGRTVAVIGTGITRSYPAQNRSLQDEISRRGLVLSQFWPDAPPTKRTFPMRNAVMSAYGYATIVVEAGEKSGARSQAALAVQHGRPVILSETVARSTRWGADLVGQPGVHVAGDPRGAYTLAKEMLAWDDHVRELLALANG